MTMLLIDRTEETFTMEQDLNNICIPFESRSGTDFTSKLLLNNQTVMDLIINSLLDMNPPDNQYFSAQTEWPDGSKSDVLYVPKTETIVDLPPILLEIQNRVDLRFMMRLIRYCTHVFDRYDVRPIVLVFVVKGIHIPNDIKLIQNKKSPYLLEAENQVWAKSVYFISVKSTENYVKNDMDPLVAISYFLSSQAVCLDTLKFQDNSTLKLLFTLCKKFLKKNEVKNNKEELEQFFEEAIQQVQQIVKNQTEKSTSTTEKDESIAEDLLKKLQSQKMKMKAEDEEKEEKDTKKRKTYIADDFLFVESISQPNKPKEWKKIFNEGKAKGFFESYTSASTLKSSYHHTKRRIQNKK